MESYVMCLVIVQTARITDTAGSMSLRLKWRDELDEDVYVYNSILIRFNFFTMPLLQLFAIEDTS